MRKVYYNEFDPFAAEWLKKLISYGYLPNGDVDSRSIKDVQATDLVGYTQLHFFAGVGGWPLALEQAGWGDRPVWSGSAPCQPFAISGRQKGFDDDRHLWPIFYKLIKECKPEFIFGEQVASGLVTGKDRGHDVSALWRREGLLRICKNWMEENTTTTLQALSKCRCQGAAQSTQDKYKSSSKSVSSFCEIEGNEEECAIRPHPRLVKTNIGQGCMRRDGDTIRLKCPRQELEYPIARSDQASKGVHKSEYKGSFICSESGLWDVGADSTFGNSAKDIECAKREIGISLEQTRRKIKESDGESWIGTVQNDLEDCDYAVGSVIVPACGFGAPHIRKRLFWVASLQSGGGNDEIGLGDTTIKGLEGHNRDGNGGGEPRWNETNSIGHTTTASSFGNTDGTGNPGPTNGFWRDADWLRCRDSKWRPIKPGTSALAHGISAGVGSSRPRNRSQRLKGYGNAIAVPVAVEFIKAFMEIEG